MCRRVTYCLQRGKSIQSRRNGSRNGDPARLPLHYLNRQLLALDVGDAGREQLCYFFGCSDLRGTLEEEKKEREINFSKKTLLRVSCKLQRWPVAGDANGYSNSRRSRYLQEQSRYMRKYGNFFLKSYLLHGCLHALIMYVLASSKDGIGCLLAYAFASLQPAIIESAHST